MANRDLQLKQNVEPTTIDAGVERLIPESQTLDNSRLDLLENKLNTAKMAKACLQKKTEKTSFISRTP